MQHVNFISKILKKPKKIKSVFWVYKVYVLGHICGIFAVNSLDYERNEKIFHIILDLCYILKRSKLCLKHLNIYFY